MTWLKKLVKQYEGDNEISSIFGVILYTEQHANIKKVLRDSDYWKSFDALSGPNWLVFSIRASKGLVEFPTSAPGVMGYMVPVWKEPKENEEILNEFGLETSEDLPQLLVFAEGEDGEILKHSISLNDQSKDKSYASIKEAIGLITRAIDGVLPENRKNSMGSFQSVNLAVSNYKGWLTLKKTIGFYRWVKSIIP